MRKKTSPRCSLEAIAAYKRIFPSTNAALEYLADGFPSLYTRTVEGLSGKFSSNELKLMIDAMNGALLTPWLSGLHIAAHISASVRLDKTHEKWGVDPVQLVKKIDSLHVFERSCLEIWAGAFWLKTNQVDVDEYVLPLVGQVKFKTI